MAWYRAGTVSVTNGSATVTGSGTSFVASVVEGEGFLGPDGRVYEIAAVVSATQLTLAAAYTGSTASGQGYAILPTQSALADLAAEAAQLVSSFAAVRDGAGQGLFGDGSAAAPGIRFSADQDTGIYRKTSNAIGFATGGVERFSLVGDKITPGAGMNGEFPVNGRIVGGFGASTSSGTQDWNHVSNAKPGSGEALLGVSSLNAPPHSGYYHPFTFEYNTKDGSGNRTQFAVPYRDTERFFGFRHFFSPSWSNWRSILIQDSGGAYAPVVDNTYPLGGGALRFSVVYAGTGSINTSDENEKTWRGGLSDTEYAAGLTVMDELGFFQFDDAITEKGPDGARYHFGVRAQRVWAAFAEQGLVDPIGATGKPGETPYAFLCFDEWEAEEAATLAPDGDPIDETTVLREAGHRYGIRPDELALFLIAVQARRQSEIEARLDALEAT